MSEREFYWREVVERQAGGVASVAEFCAAEGVSTASFYAWRKRLRDVRGESGCVTCEARGSDTSMTGGPHSCR
jgi:transposase-like protein